MVLHFLDEDLDIGFHFPDLVFVIGLEFRELVFAVDLHPESVPLEFLLILTLSGLVLAQLHPQLL